eukprot:TRINITY_DN93135_c0_g1_i1.p1 TRINITY_DN93135_c0_g1~~TRINITY_DN93135_c0_g1_i1.p1  ORF type:complete len:538 (-),score=65.97 TRINITY_DN93135_c0_g1_i1:349-1869(-)
MDEFMGGHLASSEHSAEAMSGMCLEALANSLCPSGQELVIHRECLERLVWMVRELGQGWHVKPFGSSANGFLTRGSDLDVTFYHESVPEQDSHLAINELRYRLLPMLSQQLEFEIKEAIWGARVPIVKLKFRGSVDVDLSCHNLQALQNTYLLRAYSDLSPIIQSLILCVKFWSKREGVNGAPNGYLSSYSLTLMVLYFLQVDTELAMPCLPIEHFSCYGQSPEISNFAWTCRMPLAAVLRKFFTFYGVPGGMGFDWGSEVVSVRLGRRAKAHEPVFASLPARNTRRLHVEDPFLPRNLNCVLDKDKENIFQAKLQEEAATLVSQEVPKVFLQAIEEDQMLHMRREALYDERGIWSQQTHDPWKMANQLANAGSPYPVMTSSRFNNIRHDTVTEHCESMKAGPWGKRSSPPSDNESTQSGGTSAATSVPSSFRFEQHTILAIESSGPQGRVSLTSTKKAGRNKIVTGEASSLSTAGPTLSLGSEKSAGAAPDPADLPVTKLAGLLR